MKYERLVPFCDYFRNGVLGVVYHTPYHAQARVSYSGPQSSISAWTVIGTFGSDEETSSSVNVSAVPKYLALSISPSLTPTLARRAASTPVSMNVRAGWYHVAEGKTST